MYFCINLSISVAASENYFHICMELKHPPLLWNGFDIPSPIIVSFVKFDMCDFARNFTKFKNINPTKQLGNKQLESNEI